MRKIALLVLLVPMTVRAQWPLEVTGGRQFISDGYGMRERPMGGGGGYHFGIDYACRVGTRVLSLTEGTVIVCAFGDKVFGKYIVVRTRDGYDILYGHLSETWKARGTFVKENDVIGLSGNTGQSTGPHLHVQISIDPVLFFSQKREEKRAPFIPTMTWYWRQ